MEEESNKSWVILPINWQDFARRYIGPTGGKSDVMIGVRDERFHQLFPFTTIEENKAHGREILDKLSKILGIPRKDMNLGVRFDDFETRTAGYNQAIHYTYRYHGGRIEYYYAY